MTILGALGVAFCVPLTSRRPGRYTARHGRRADNDDAIGQRPRRLAWSRTPAFHADNTGSNPVGDAIQPFETYRLRLP